MSSPENLPSFPQQPQPPGALALRPSGALQTQLLAQQQEADAQADDEIDLKAILRTLLKHKWTIVGTTALCTLAAVVFDWAGTVVDFGSRAPVGAFVELFARHGVTISDGADHIVVGRPIWQAADPAAAARAVIAELP